MILMMIQIRAARYLDTGKYLVNAARAYGKRTRGSAVTGRHSVSRPTCCKRRCWLIAGCWLNNVVGWYTDCRYRSVRRPPVKKTSYVRFRSRFWLVRYHGSRVAVLCRRIILNIVHHWCRRQCVDRTPTMKALVGELLMVCPCLSVSLSVPCECE